MDSEAITPKSAVSDAFMAYLEQEVGVASRRRALIGIIAFVPALICFVHFMRDAKLYHSPLAAPAVWQLGYVLGILAVASVAWALTSKKEGKRSPIQHQAHGILMKIYSAKQSGTVKVGIVVGGRGRTLQSHGAGLDGSYVISEVALILMNEAAKSTLAARTALDSLAWQSASGPRAQARDQARFAVNEAMSRIVVLATTLGDSREVRALISDLAEVSAELSDSTRKMESSAGQAGDGSLGLRASLEQLREISWAEDEIFEHHHRL